MNSIYQNILTSISKGEKLLAGEFLGMKLICLQAGSGATHPIETKMISGVKQELTIPLIVGGGIIPNWPQNVAYKLFLFRLCFVKK